MNAQPARRLNREPLGGKGVYMINSGLRCRYLIFNIIQGVIFILILLLSISTIPFSISQYQTEGNNSFILLQGIVILLAILESYYFLTSILFTKIIITDDGIIIKDINTNISINWENIVDVVEYAPNILGFSQKFIQLKEKTQLLNRGLNKYIFYWYKVFDVSISQYNENIIAEIRSRIKR
jgi:hypothetical protein